MPIYTLSCVSILVRTKATACYHTRCLMYHLILSLRVSLPFRYIEGSDHQNANPLRHIPPLPPCISRLNSRIRPNSHLHRLTTLLDASFRTGTQHNHITHTVPHTSTLNTPPRLRKRQGTLLRTSNILFTNLWTHVATEHCSPPTIAPAEAKPDTGRRHINAEQTVLFGSKRTVS